MEHSIAPIQVVAVGEEEDATEEVKGVSNRGRTNLDYTTSADFEDEKLDNSNQKKPKTIKDLKNIFDFIHKNGITGDYRRVAIMGNQNTGKSYLLNQLYGWGFRVMDHEQGVQQTTEGVWLSANTEHKVLVFDIEGSDSQERNSEGKQIERKIVLYALAMWEALIINFPASSAGQRTGSCSEILEIILECYVSHIQPNAYAEQEK